MLPFPLFRTQFNFHGYTLQVEILAQIFIEACLNKDGGQTAATLLIVSCDVHAIVSPYQFYSICVTGEATLGLLDHALKRATAEQFANIN
jgi:hypothetical protein